MFSLSFLYCLFQSQNGLILTCTSNVIKLSVTIISIPKWSDFNKQYDGYGWNVKDISIPKWSDFNDILLLINFTLMDISIPKWSDFNNTI